MTFKSVKKKSPQAILDLLFGQVEKKQYNENEYYVKVIKVLDGVAYVNINGDVDYITQRSGSAGALYFKVEVLFNLTEFNYIDYVYFNDGGDHLVQGKSERLDMWTYMSDYRKKKNKKLAEDRLSPFNDNLYTPLGLLAEVGDEITIKKLEKLKDTIKELKKVKKDIEELEEKEESITYCIEEIKIRLKTSK